MSLLSVVTAVYGPSTRYLPDAYASLAAQDLPEGWDWEWLVQEDGDGVGADAHLPTDDPRVRIASARHGGPHVARTVALGRSHGSLIKVLDADDVLLPDTLARDITLLTDRPEIGWTTSLALDLLPDGSTRRHPGDPVTGVIKRGAVLEDWRVSRRPMVHPATLCARRELVALLGGWMALPASGDTGLLLGLDALQDGWLLEEPGMLYRVHQDQITQHPNHSAGEEWEARMQVMQERAEALHAWVADSEPHRLPVPP
ncbi:glycosyltransferase family 2 protein [Kitasatospora sp. NPDC092286]|uniref:glycosyltransferase family 2 protein n=1 Tax=Kitasatospora sp. NPDC092286 TaxID=3364087 RepID=UPI0038113E9B